MMSLAVVLGMIAHGVSQCDVLLSGDVTERNVDKLGLYELTAETCSNLPVYVCDAGCASEAPLFLYKVGAIWVVSTGGASGRVFSETRAYPVYLAFQAWSGCTDDFDLLDVDFFADDDQSATADQIRSAQWEERIDSAIDPFTNNPTIKTECATSPETSAPSTEPEEEQTFAPSTEPEDVTFAPTAATPAPASSCVNVCPAVCESVCDFLADFNSTGVDIDDIDNIDIKL